MDKTIDTSFFDDKKDGQLITEIKRYEMPGLVAKTLDESIDPLVLLGSESKKDRVLARKLICLMQLANQSMVTFLWVNNGAWSILYFRKKQEDEIAVEVLL